MNPIEFAESAFDCEIGEPKSNHLGCPYVTLGFQHRGFFRGRRRVLDALTEEFKGIRERFPFASNPKLYWRLSDRVQVERHGRTWQVRTRICIPGFDWSCVITKPEGLPYPQVY